MTILAIVLGDILSLILIASSLFSITGGEPEGDIGTALQGGKATWCAPTPTHCQSWGDGAMVGAVPSFSYGDEPYLATVCHSGECVTVTVVSYCACGDRGGVPTVIDLSPMAFSRLAPLSRGVIDVTVESGGSAQLPATDTEEQP